MSGRRLILVFTLCLLAAACRSSATRGGVKLDLTDHSGLVPKPLDRLEAGDSLTLGLTGLAPRSRVELTLNDDLGKEWSYARLFADDRGRIPPQLFWYQSGVIGTTSRNITFKPDPAFVTFEEAETYFAQHPLTLTVQDAERRVLVRQPIRIRPRTTPMIYPSNEKGILQNSLNVRSEDLYVSGRNFPPGSTVHLATVDNEFTWAAGDRMNQRATRTIKLGPGQTSFTERIWPRGASQPGAYDLVARIDRELTDIISTGDIVSFNEDTGVVMFLIINGNIVIDSAGRERNAPAKFEFSDSFEKGENVWAAVDPTDVPAVHSGGNYAKYWVVEHQPNAYWDGGAPALTDVSGGTEIQRVKYWCINMSRRIVWSAATQPEPIKPYDVIVDFGAVPSNTGADFVDDNKYDKGLDFIDGYDADAGFWVGENPGTAGSFAVGRVDFLDENGISGITDPTGLTGPTYDVKLAWARIMYPATAPGVGTPVSPLQPSYPVALFQHGRHWNCDNDGSGPLLGGGYNWNCTPASNRIPSHLGYDYIMERLASQGVFCISISTHDIQPDQSGAWNYNARGRLILKFLDKLRDWNDNGTDPFGPLFTGKIDMSRIALSGHSRGGEGVVAAEVLNQTWPAPHSILAVNAIAPTDQDSMTEYVPSEAAYYLIVGARDGDVSNMQGVRTYDRAFPDGAPDRKPKTFAYVYGANHNYFNTIWTPTAALGMANPWAGSVDDYPGSMPALTAAQQREMALTTVTAFFRWQLLGQIAFREILTGRIKPATVPNQSVFLTFQDGERTTIDNFEQPGMVATSNTVAGTNAAPGFGTFEERRLNHDGSIYPGNPPTDNFFYHDTIGLKLAWAAPQTYTVNIPGGAGNFTAFSHLTLRIAKKASVNGTGPDINVNVQLEDSLGHTALWPLRSDQFDRIPHAYEDPESFPTVNVLTGVRIPLRNFTQNNSMVDLANIVKITIAVEGSGEIAIDDIEVGK